MRISREVEKSREVRTEILIVGGGLGGVAAALAATDLGCRVILTEETDWLGGQLSSQAVPPDEHMWIEKSGRTESYGELRRRIRHYYHRNFPLSQEALQDEYLNPGLGLVSQLCHLPEIAVKAIGEMLEPAIAQGMLRVYYGTVPKSVVRNGNKIEAVEFAHGPDDQALWVSADYVLDATDLGDLLPLANLEYVSGAEAFSETGEPHAVPGKPEPGNVQAITWCFPLAYDSTATELRNEYAISRPTQYDYWRSYVPRMAPPWSGPLLSLQYCHPPTCHPVEFPLFPSLEGEETWNLWQYRRILAKDVFAEPSRWREVSLINWPQNDYLEGNLIDASPEKKIQILSGAKQLSLSLAYWLQNEVPRPDGGNGYPGLHLRPDLTGTTDGLAKAPYIRESRRIRALTTVTELEVGWEAREGRWPDPFRDSIGIGYYPIDLHPSVNGKNYIDIPALPFQIPLGSLIPRTEINLLAAAKNIGTSHITNGCYRLHPTEWNIGEAAGSLAVFCLRNSQTPHKIWSNDALLAEFQDIMINRGVMLAWSKEHRTDYAEVIGKPTADRKDLNESAQNER